jgi:hypothetical protein
MKGQTAVEYLMTYGWAILIILIVAGVLAYYGIFAPAGFLGPSSKGFTQVSVLQPWDVNSGDVAGGGGKLKMQLENRVGQDINIHMISAVMGNVVPTATDTCAIVNAAPPATQYTYETDTVTAGTKYPTSGLLTLQCDGIAGGSTGSSYTITVLIEYYVGGVASGTLLSQTGTLSGSRS